MIGAFGDPCRISTRRGDVVTIDRGILALLEAKPGTGDELAADPDIRPVDVIAVE